MAVTLKRPPRPKTPKGKPKKGDRTVGRGWRVVALALVCVVMLLGILGSRLAYLQVIRGDRHRQLAENNRIRLVPKAPERGRILDRNGKILATSRLSHGVYLWPVAQPPDQWQQVLSRLAPLLNVSVSDLTAKLEREGYNSPMLVRVGTGLKPEQVTLLMEHHQELPGVRVEPESVRHYPDGALLAHVLGYTGEITETELTQRRRDAGTIPREKAYRLGDIVGKMGAEAAFESQLRGSWGGEQVEVDALGKVVRVLGQKLPRAGTAVRLTIDRALQQAAAEILGDRRGGIVALNPQNGEILAMVSYPTYDPNIFSGRVSAAAWQKLQSSGRPFLNRTLQVYPPASTFKVVTMTAGLESGKFSPNDLLGTYPYLDIGGFQFWDHNRAGFGTIGFREAMAYSSNTFFGQVGQRVGERTLAEWARKYGFGTASGIELASEEERGTVPDPEWKLKVLKEPWYAGNTINMSIGQGDVQASPLQVTVMSAIVANGGYVVRPHLNLEDAKARQWRRSLTMKPDTVRALQQSMRAVFEIGTAAGLGSLPVAIAGKSGTAEDGDRPNHAWFTLYAPYEKPEIVITAFGENAGGGGSSVAGPMAVQTLEAYLRLRQPNPPT
jgi:penicillin-binding protein 2